MGTPNPVRILRLDEWPDHDQQLWRIGLSPGDLLEGEQYAAGLRHMTLRNSRRGYGRWLAVLTDHDPAALLLPPAERVKPARVRLFLSTLQACGNTNNTIQARFWELRSAMRIICPRHDFQWLNKPGEVYLSALLPATLRARRFVDLRELASWGEDLMRRGLEHDADPRIESFRNGLLIAFFASRAPRQRSMASLRLGHNIHRRENRFQIAFRAEDMKSRKPLEYFLPDQLTPYIDYYLEAVRPRLLGGRSHDWFWVNRDGNRLAEIGIEGVISRAAKSQLGFVIRTHAFRHSYATTKLMLDPTTPKKVAAVLGNSPYVVHKSYDLGGQVEAANSWQDTLDSLMED